MPRFSMTRGALSAAASGGSKLFQAILGADKAYQDGYDKSALSQARIDQTEAAAAKSNADAAQDQAETNILQSRPDVFNETVANRAGTTIPVVQAFRNYVNTGYLPERQLPGPPTEQGVGPGSVPVVSPELQTKLGQLIGQMGLLQGNVKDLNPNELAGADQKYAEMGLRDDVLAGRRTAGDVASAQRAIKAGDLFKQSNNGSVIDVATGDVSQDSPIAQAVVKLKGAQADKATATKASKGPMSAAETDRATILLDELSKVRARKQSAQGLDLSRAQADEASVISELKAMGIKNIDQITKAPKEAGAGKPPSEDERKAAGWVAQAQFAFDNINKVLAEDPNAAKPSLVNEALGAIPAIGPALKNKNSSDARQRFEQATSSFAEAALRAATGAGVTREEAVQKIRELTPVWGDKPGTIAQKKQALTVYLDSLKTRAGRALPAQAAPTPPTPGISADQSGNSPVGVIQRNVRVTY